MKTSVVFEKNMFQRGAVSLLVIGACQCWAAEPIDRMVGFWHSSKFGKDAITSATILNDMNLSPAVREVRGWTSNPQGTAFLNVEVHEDHTVRVYRYVKDRNCKTVLAGTIAVQGDLLSWDITTVPGEDNCGFNQHEYREFTRVRR